MTTYSRPGVFIDETLLPLAAAANTGSNAIAAFVGTSALGGPLGPTLITSWPQYVALFGDDASETDDLGYAVFSFFNNGGSQCYVVRAALTGATSASLALKDLGDLSGESGTAVKVLDVTAKAPGTWASNTTTGTVAVYVTVNTSTADGRFDLIIEVGQGSARVAREQFISLTLDPTDERNALSIVNSQTIGSQYVTLSLDAATNNKVWGTDYANPAALTATALGTSPNGTAGSDGTGSPDYVTAVETLATVQGNPNFDLNVPGVTDTTALTSIVNWAESVGNVMVVVDGPKQLSTDTMSTYATALQTLEAALPASSQVAVYGPWLAVQDRKVSGATRWTAPGGLVIGQYAQTDTSRGVQRSPAGTITALRGVINVAFNFDGPTLDTLNNKGINVIRSVPGAGICIMGARTLDAGFPDRYINIRRSLMLLERDLVNLTQWAVFEQNNSTTWDTISATITQYLTQQWQSGVLAGDTADQAFFVTCDSTNNDPTSVAGGLVNVTVGVALSSPAEFIVIQIGQFDGTSTVTTTS